MKKVFVLGSLNIDFYYKLQEMPKPGETIFSQGFMSFPGGKGSNQAVGCAKQGVSSYMIGTVGDDAFGETLIYSLKKNFVNVQFVEKNKSKPTGSACILLENSENRIIVDSGANALISDVRIEKVLRENAHSGDILLMQLELPLKQIEFALKLAKSIKLITVLNAAPYQEKLIPLASWVDLLIVNQSEAESLIQQAINFNSIDESLNQLLKLGSASVLLTLGKEGSYYKNKNDVIFMPARSVEAVDTTGAGDAFIGTFVASLAKNELLKNALKKATLAASLTIQKHGIHDAMPCQKTLDKILISEEEKQ